MTDRAPTASEWSVLVSAERIDAGGGGLVVPVVAPSAVLPAIAARLRVPAVAALRCDWTLRPVPGRDAIEAEGVLEAELTQDCVVTLEPFTDRVHERFTVRFAPADELEDNDDIEAPDELAYHGRSVDLGDATIEQLALALDPFPRAPGLDPDARAGVLDGVPDAAPDGTLRPGSSDTATGSGGRDAAEPSGDPAKASPFAVLAARRRPH